MAKIFYQGTLDQYNTYKTWVNDTSRANICVGGEVYQKEGVDVPANQKNDQYSAAIPHISIDGSYIWEFGAYPNPLYGLTEYSLEEAVSNGYISNDDPSSL